MIRPMDIHAEKDSSLRKEHKYERRALSKKSALKQDNCLSVEEA